MNTPDLAWICLHFIGDFLLFHLIQGNPNIVLEWYKTIQRMENQRNYAQK